MGVPTMDPTAALARLKGTARELVALLGPATPDDLHRSPGGPESDEWSPATVVTHLADAEMVYAVRIRMVLTGDRPYIPAFDENAWVRRFADLEVDVKDTLARWRALRDSTVRVLDSLEDDEWRLTGIHAERGEMTVGQIAVLLAKHDADHLAQIRSGLSVL